MATKNTQKQHSKQPIPDVASVAKKLAADAQHIFGDHFKNLTEDSARFEIDWEEDK